MLRSINQLGFDPANNALDVRLSGAEVDTLIFGSSCPSVGCRGFVTVFGHSSYVAPLPVSLVCSRSRQSVGATVEAFPSHRQPRDKKCWPANTNITGLDVRATVDRRPLLNCHGPTRKCYLRLLFIQAVEYIHLLDDLELVLVLVITALSNISDISINLHFNWKPLLRPGPPFDGDPVDA